MTSVDRIQVRAPYKIRFIFIVTEQILKVARLLFLRTLRRRFYALHVAQQLAYSKTWSEQIRPTYLEKSVISLRIIIINHLLGPVWSLQLRQLRSRSRTFPVCVDIDRSISDRVH